MGENYAKQLLAEHTGSVQIIISELLKIISELVKIISDIFLTIGSSLKRVKPIVFFDELHVDFNLRKKYVL